MSKLNELLQELCPNGVGYKAFGEMAQIVRGASPRPIKNYITDNSNGVNWIKIGDVAVGDKYIRKSAEKITKEGAQKSRFVKKGDFILSNSMSFGRPYILDLDGCIHDGWLAISKFQNYYITDFLYYLLNSSDIQNEMKKRASFGGAVQNLNADIVKAICLPVPPLEVQREIVHILDALTVFTEELKDKLTAELIARKKQYNYYRDMLLTFNEVEYIRKVKLNEVCEVYDGIHQTPKYVSNGVPFVSVENIDDIYGTTKYISYEDYDKYKVKPKIGNVFMTRITAGVIGKCAVVTNSDNMGYYVSLALLRPNQQILDSFYLKYYLESSLGKRELGKRILWDATPTKINKEDIGKIIITIPTLDVQKRIVNVLNNFGAICSDLNIGLPAEIEARQKQYEYYRDKLLDFKEKK